MGIYAASVITAMDSMEDAGINIRCSPGSDRGSDSLPAGRNDTAANFPDPIRTNLAG